MYGPSEDDRTFVITAIGNSITLAAPGNLACGLDSHKPDLFVPVPGVLYLRSTKAADRMRDIVEQAWTTIERSEASFVLLNGVWPFLQNPLRRCLDLAGNRHVIIASELLPDIRGHCAPSHIQMTAVRVSPHKTRANWISVEVESLANNPGSS